MMLVPRGPSYAIVLTEVVIINDTKRSDIICWFICSLNSLSGRVNLAEEGNVGTSDLD